MLLCLSWIICRNWQIIVKFKFQWRFLMSDDGKNSDKFTRDLLNSCIAWNQITKGKTDASKGLRRHILEGLEESFPDEVEAYGEIHGTSAAESKRIAQAQSILPNGAEKERKNTVQGNSLKDSASSICSSPWMGYQKSRCCRDVCPSYKSTAIEQGEQDEASARIEMQNYVAASAPVIQHVDKLFLSRELGRLVKLGRSDDSSLSSCIQLCFQA